MQMIKIEDVQDKVLQLRNENVIIDSDVAVLYGVETKRINEAVKNNPEKFPEGYVFKLSPQEKTEVVEIFDHLNQLKFSKVEPTVFTELISDILGNDLNPTESETELELNFAMLKLKHNVVRKK